MPLLIRYRLTINNLKITDHEFLSSTLAPYLTDKMGKRAKKKLWGLCLINASNASQSFSGFHQVSTDEVYGSLELDDERVFNSNSCYNPRNPYSASKAAADHLVRAYVNTYGIRATISNCSNNFGPNQHPEKLIPKTIFLASRDEKIPIYGNGANIRDWLFVEDHCKGIDAILKKGKIGRTYLISDNNQVSNRELVLKILAIMKKDQRLIKYIADRPGHDLRYALDSDETKKELGWKAEADFDESLIKTVMHYSNL